MFPGFCGRWVDALRDHERFFNQLAGVAEAVRPAPQQVGEAVQMIGELGTISNPAIDLDSLPISFFSCFRFAGLLREQSQLVPRPGGFCQTTAFLSDPRRFLIVPFGFTPIPVIAL